MRKLCSVFTCLAFLLMFLGPAAGLRAQEAPKKAEEPPKPRLHAKGTVIAVDVKNNCIEVQTGKEAKHAFTITKETEIKKEGKEIGLAEIVAGNYVTMSYTKDDAGNRVAKRIRVFDKEPEKPAEPAKEQKKEKEKPSEKPSETPPAPPPSAPPAEK